MAYSQRGFTLLDAMLALAVLAITSSLGVPALQHFLIESRLTSSSNELIAHLRLARSEAIKQNRRIVICPRQAVSNHCAQKTWQQGWMLFVDSNDNHELDTGESIVRIFGPLTQQVSLQTGGRSRIIFQSHGRTPGSNATFAFCHVNVSSGRQVVLSGSGRTRVTRDACLT